MKTLNRLIILYIIILTPTLSYGLDINDKGARTYYESVLYPFLEFNDGYYARPGTYQKA